VSSRTPADGTGPYAGLLEIALDAARRAGALLRDGRPADLGAAATKSSPTDVVTEMDIAAELDGEVVAGVVEAPMRGETYQAVLGGGAFVNGLPARCRPAPEPAHALVGTGFGYRAERRAAQAEVVRRLLPQVRDIRRAGSAAIDLADVGCGRLDAYFERGLNPWDLAAGDLFAREAGALTGGRRGQRPSGELTLAAPPGLFEPLQALLEDLGAWHD
jgi:myo-inositol-1(or 4)-monophosphatase